MAQSDMTNKLEALFVGEVEDVVASLLEDVIIIPVAASADASTAVAETSPYPVPYACEVKSAYFAAATSAASDASNYATIKVLRRYSDGTLSSEVATGATSAVAVTAKEGFALTVATSLANLSAGDCLAGTIAKAGTGVSTGAGSLVIKVRRNA